MPGWSCGRSACVRHISRRVRTWSVVGEWLQQPLPAWRGCSCATPHRPLHGRHRQRRMSSERCGAAVRARMVQQKQTGKAVLTMLRGCSWALVRDSGLLSASLKLLRAQSARPGGVVILAPCPCCSTVQCCRVCSRPAREHARAAQPVMCRGSGGRTAGARLSGARRGRAAERPAPACPWPASCGSQGRSHVSAHQGKTCMSLYAAWTRAGGTRQVGALLLKVAHASPPAHRPRACAFPGYSERQRAPPADVKAKVHCVAEARPAPVLPDGVGQELRGIGLFAIGLLSTRQLLSCSRQGRRQRVRVQALCNRLDPRQRPHVAPPPWSWLPGWSCRGRALEPRLPR